MVEPYKILGISENAEIEEVKVAFQEKKKELQKQLLSKKPEEQKAAANQLQELVAAYGAIKKQRETAIGNGSFSSSVSKEPQKHVPVMGMEVEKKSSTELSPLLPSYQLDENETEESSWPRAGCGSCWRARPRKTARSRPCARAPSAPRSRPPY